MSRQKMEVTPRMSELLRLIAKHGPVSKNRLAEISGVVRQNVDKYMRRLHEQKLVHIDSFDRNPDRENYMVALYVSGPGDDAVRERKPKKRYKRDASGRRCIPIHERYVSKSTVVVRRDPFIAAFFGEAA
jgi:predicted ArsR family transcriptional regulator